MRLGAGAGAGDFSSRDRARFEEEKKTIVEVRCSFAALPMEVIPREYRMINLSLYSFPQQNVVEPMQVDAPTEDNDNAEEEPYIVENPTLVRMKIDSM